MCNVHCANDGCNIKLIWKHAQKFIKALKYQTKVKVTQIQHRSDIQLNTIIDVTNFKKDHFRNIILCQGLMWESVFNEKRVKIMLHYNLNLQNDI
jgi:hypothetical protein